MEKFQREQQGDYLSAAHLKNREWFEEIERVTAELVGDRQKAVVAFRGKKRRLPLNAVNTQVLVAAYGAETNAWTGQPVTLFPARVEFRGDLVSAIRLRIPPPTPAVSVSQPAQAAPDVVTEAGAEDIPW